MQASANSRERLLKIIRGNRGKTMFWKGYKFQVDRIDGDIPASARVHDSQPSISLAQMSAERFRNLYRSVQKGGKNMSS